MESVYTRTELILGKTAVEKLKNSSVIVFGVGGVGGYTVEALARTGVGKIALVDFDTVNVTNLNRQIITDLGNISRKKVEVCKERILKINDKIEVTIFDEFFDENSKINLAEYDYIVDAIDSIKSKIFLIKKAKELGVKIISCMSAGNKLDATLFTVSDIYSTTDCPIARILRRELKKEGIDSLKVVYSKEKAVDKPDGKVNTIGSLAHVVGVAGLIMAGEVIKDLV